MDFDNGSHDGQDGELVCSFCGKPQDECVSSSHHDVLICDEWYASAATSSQTATRAISLRTEGTDIERRSSITPETLLEDCRYLREYTDELLRACHRPGAR